jgi:hypothetical protein
MIPFATVGFLLCWWSIRHGRRARQGCRSGPRDHAAVGRPGTTERSSGEVFEVDVDDSEMTSSMGQRRAPPATVAAGSPARGRRGRVWARIEYGAIGKAPTSLSPDQAAGPCPSFRSFLLPPPEGSPSRGSPCEEQGFSSWTAAQRARRDREKASRSPPPIPPSTPPKKRSSNHRSAADRGPFAQLFTTVPQPGSVCLQNWGMGPAKAGSCVTAPLAILPATG